MAVGSAQSAKKGRGAAETARQAIRVGARGRARIRAKGRDRVGLG